MLNKEQQIDILFELDKICFGNRAYTINQYQEMILNKAYSFYTILNGDKIKIGFIIILDNLEQNYELIKVGIIPEFRNKNYAYSALNELFKILNFNTFILEVSQLNDNAIKLYKKLGFNLLHTRKKYYKDNSDALIMIKKQLKSKL